MTDKSRFCVDCVHCERNTFTVIPEHNCMRVARDARNPVTGEGPYKKNVLDCRTERELETRCGAEGRYFVKKESKE